MIGASPSLAVCRRMVLSESAIQVETFTRASARVLKWCR